MIICSCTSKRRRCIKKSRRKIISSVAHHPSVSVPRVAAAAAGAPPMPFAFVPPFVADHHGVGMDLLVFASLHLEGVGTAPDIVPGSDAVVAGIASTMEHRDGGEPEHNFAGPELVRKLWPFDNVHQSCYLETDA
jgi:hypothetical protein